VLDKQKKNNHMVRGIAMLKKMFIICFVVWAVISAAACTKTNQETKTDNITSSIGTTSELDLEDAIQLSDGIPEQFNFNTIIENDILKVSIDEGSDALQILDKRSGHIWEPSINANEKDLFLSETWEQNLASMFYIKFTQKSSDGQERIINTSIKSQKPYIWINKSNNSFTIKYYLANREIGFEVEYVLKDNTLEVSIPDSGIREDGDSKLVAIEMLPILGATPNGIDGYIMIPDGSGALVDFTNTLRRPSNYRWAVYSRFNIEMNPYDKLDMRDEQQLAKTGNVGTAMLPVYGVKVKDNAIVSFVTQGDSNFNIYLSTSGRAVDLNRVSGEFVFRNTYFLRGSDIRADGSQEADILHEIIEDKRIEMDRSIQYVFLTGENANYSGMANSYRNYLIENEKLNNSVEGMNSIPLNLELLMGIEEERIMFNKFISMTNFSQAQEIVDLFLEGGIRNINLNLKGWNKRGYGAHPFNYPAERRLGGNNALNDFMEYCKEKGIKTTTEVNFIDVIMSNANLAMRRSVVRDGSGYQVTDRLRERYLVNPKHAHINFESFITKMKDYEIGGVSFDRIGSLIYTDYSREEISYRNDTVEQWKRIMETAQNSYDFVSVRGGNLYTLKYADLLYDIPLGGSHSMVTDVDVPFYQMIVHGSIPYTTIPVNLYYDHTLQKLLNIEYGGLPYFILTYNQAYHLQNTDFNKLFSSYHQQWLDDATALYNEYNEKLLPVMKSYIVDHKRLDSDLVMNTYSNGYRIYINYSAEKVTFDGITIESMDYVIVQ